MVIVGKAGSCVTSPDGQEIPNEHIAAGLSRARSQLDPTTIFAEWQSVAIATVSGLTTASPSRHDPDQSGARFARIFLAPRTRPGCRPSATNSNETRHVRRWRRHDWKTAPQAHGNLCVPVPDRVLMPALAVATVGGYGLAVWVYQIVAGPPGPPARTECKETPCQLNQPIASTAAP